MDMLIVDDFVYYGFNSSSIALTLNKANITKHCYYSALSLKQLDGTIIKVFFYFSLYPWKCSTT